MIDAEAERRNALGHTHNPVLHASMLDRPVSTLTRKNGSRCLKGMFNGAAGVSSQDILTCMSSYLHKLQAYARKANSQTRGHAVTPAEHVSQDVDFAPFTGTDNWVSGGQGQYCMAPCSMGQMVLIGLQTTWEIRHRPISLTG